MPAPRAYAGRARPDIPIAPDRGYRACALRSGVAARPAGVTFRQFVGAACFCGVGDVLALVMADRAFGPETAAVAKLGVLVGSVVAAVIGLGILRGTGAGRGRDASPRQRHWNSVHCSMLKSLMVAATSRVPA
jgi:hypothetical protein